MTDSGAPTGLPPPDGKPRDRYPVVTRLLHWLVVVLLAAQFTLGYALTRNDDLLEPIGDRWFGGEEEAVVLVHVGLGLVILAVALVRLVVRRVVDLPPWAPGLSAIERRVSHAVEVVFYWMLLVMPLSGIGLFALSGEDWDISEDHEWIGPLEVVDDDVWLVVHVASHVVFFMVLAVHLAIVARHTVLRREGLLRRMLW